MSTEACVQMTLPWTGSNMDGQFLHKLVDSIPAHLQNLKQFLSVLVKLLVVMKNVMLY